LSRSRRLPAVVALRALAIALVIGPIGGGPTGAATELEAGRYLFAGRWVGGIELGDLDGDGEPDLVATLPAEDLVTVSLGDRRGRYLPFQEILVPGAPQTVKLADFDADGVLDAAILTWDPSHPLSVLFGDGTGGLGDLRNFALGPGPWRLAVADLDGDALPDLVAVDFFEPVATVVLNLGNRSFGGPSTVPLDAYPQALAIDDVDGDGIPDAAIAATTSGGTGAGFVLLGDGVGSFGPPLPFDASSHVGLFRIETLDADENGLRDLMVVSSGIASGAVGRLSILFGDGSGDFATAPTWTIDRPAPIGGAAAFDLDRDGHLDLTVGGPDTLTLRGDGAGGFEESNRVLMPLDPRTRIGDFDRDGHPDLVGPYREHGIAFLPGNGRGGWLGPRPAAGVGATEHGLAAADFDRDGRVDVAALLADPLDIGKVRLWRGDGAGGLLFPTESEAFPAPTGFAVGDFVEDGNPDAVLVAGTEYPADLGIWILPGDGAGSLAPGVFAIPAEVTGPLVVDDFDADGHLDVAAYAAGGIAVFTGDGAGALTPHGILDTGPSPGAAVAADLDADGAPDILYPSPESDRVSVHFGLGDGTFGVRHDLPLAGGPVAVGASDLDGNGTLDVAVACAGSGEIVRLYGDGAGHFVGQEVDAIGRRASALVVVDLDGMGLPEILLHDAETDALFVLGADAEGSLSRIDDFGGGFLHGSIALGDFDGDGHPDPVASRTQGERTRPAVLRNATSDALDCRTGNVNEAQGPRADVLLVNGSPGLGADRIVAVGTTDALTVRIDLPPALARPLRDAAVPTPRAPFALCAWVGLPAPSTVEDLPFAYGITCLSPPLSGGLPTPAAIWNNTGDPAFGASTHPSKPAPSLVFRAPQGIGTTATFTLQGLIVDPGSPSGRFGVTNAVVVKVR